MKEGWNTQAEADAFRYVETRHWTGDVDAFFGLGEGRAQALIDPVIDWLQAARWHGRATALDLGCGVGRFTRALSRRFATVYGVDVSERMIEQATALHAAPDYAGIRFCPSDGKHIPPVVPAASIDFAWSYEVLQHMPSTAVIASNLRELARVLKPDGYAMLHFRTGYDSGRAFYRLLQKLPTPVVRLVKRLAGKDGLTSDQAFRGTKPMTRDGIRALCAANGLAVSRLVEDPTHRPGSRVFAIAQRIT